MNNITGPFNTSTALQWVATGQQWINSAAAECVIDLANASQIDSAAIVVMLSWKRYAAQQQKKLILQHLPEKLTAMLELYSLENIFNPSY